MPKLEIDTDAVRETSESIKKHSNNISHLSSDISGYSLPDDENFDFGSPKGKLAEAMKICSEYMQYDALVIKGVADEHDDLQNQLKFDVESDYSNGSYSPGSEQEEAGEYEEYEGYDGYAGYYDPGVRNTTGTKNTDQKHTNDNTDTTQQTQTTTETEIVEDDELLEDEYDGITENKPTDEELEPTPDENEPAQEETSTPIPVETDITEVNYAYIKEDTLTEESKKLISNASFDSETSYLMIGNRYVISADPSVGKVGDIIRINNKDESTIECVIGINTNADQFKNTINFIVDRETWSDKQPLEISEKLLENKKSIENLGQIELTEVDANGENSM